MSKASEWAKRSHERPVYEHGGDTPLRVKVNDDGTCDMTQEKANIRIPLALMPAVLRWFIDTFGDAP